MLRSGANLPAIARSPPLPGLSDLRAATAHADGVRTARPIARRNYWMDIQHIAMPEAGKDYPATGTHSWTGSAAKRPAWPIWSSCAGRMLAVEHMDRQGPPAKSMRATPCTLNADQASSIVPKSHVSTSPSWQLIHAAHRRRFAAFDRDVVETWSAARSFSHRAGQPKVMRGRRRVPSSRAASEASSPSARLESARAVGLASLPVAQGRDGRCGDALAPRGIEVVELGIQPEGRTARRALPTREALSRSATGPSACAARWSRGASGSGARCGRRRRAARTTRRRSGTGSRVIPWARAVYL